MCTYVYIYIKIERDSVDEILEDVGIVRAVPGSILWARHLLSLGALPGWFIPSEILYGRCLYGVSSRGIPNTMGFNMCQSHGLLTRMIWGTPHGIGNLHIVKSPQLSAQQHDPILWRQATWIDLTHLGNMVKGDVKLLSFRVSADKAFPHSQNLRVPPWMFWRPVPKRNAQLGLVNP